MLVSLLLNTDMLDPYYGVHAGAVSVAAVKDELEEELKLEAVEIKKKAVKVSKGVPVYRVEFPEYPRFEAKMWEFKALGNHEVANVMKEMLSRQRERDEEEAIIALLH